MPTEYPHVSTAAVAADTTIVEGDARLSDARTPTDAGAQTAWGTFAPTVTGDTPPSFTTNTGRYRRFGDVVFVEIDLLNSSGGTPGAGAAQLNVALPVAAGASAVTRYRWAGMAKNGATQHQLMGQIAPSATTIQLSRWNTINGLTNLSAGSMNDVNSREIRLSFWYES